MVAITRRAWLQGAAALALTSHTWADNCPSWSSPMRGQPPGHGISPVKRSRMPFHRYKNKFLTSRWPPSSRIAFPIPWIQPSSPAPTMASRIRML